jgi:hypothetical protein
MDSLSDLNGDNNHHDRGQYCSQRQNRSGDNPAHSKNQKTSAIQSNISKFYKILFRPTPPMGWTAFPGLV